MEVDLVPLVCIQQPDYWGIEVVGRLPGMGLPALAPYIVSLPLDGFIGTEGIEVIGATRSEKLKVAGEEPMPGCSDWSAVHDRSAPGLPILYMRGKCRFPRAGYSVELKRHEPPGFNPRDLLLDRIAHPQKGLAYQWRDQRS